MKTIFNDILQDSDADPRLISPALADKYTLLDDFTIFFDSSVYIDAIAIANLIGITSIPVLEITLTTGGRVLGGANAVNTPADYINGGDATNDGNADSISGGDAFIESETFTINAADKNIIYQLENGGIYHSMDVKIMAGKGGSIGRLIAGRLVDIPTAVAKEPGYASTSTPRTTLSGQIIPGAGGYNYRFLSLDSRYKIDEIAMQEIADGYKTIGKGYPFLLDLSDEAYKLGYNTLYATENSQQQMSFESGIPRFLYSRKFDFKEAF